MDSALSAEIQTFIAIGADFDGSAIRLEILQKIEKLGKALGVRV
jgi:hypothetical protein